MIMITRQYRTTATAQEARHYRVHSLDTDRVLTTGHMVSRDSNGSHWRLESVHNDGIIVVSRLTRCGRQIRAYRVDTFQCELHADDVKLAASDVVKLARFWFVQIIIAVLAALVGLYVTHMFGG